MRRLAVLFPLLALVAVASGQRARDVLARVATAVNATKSLTASCTRQQISPVTGAGPSVSYSVSLSKPNKARIDLPEELIVADGTTITTYDKAGKTYLKKAQTDVELKALLASTEMSLFGAFFDVAYFDKTAGGKIGKRSRKGVSYDLVEGTIDIDGNQAAAFYIDPADKLLKIGEFTAEGQTDTVVVSVKELQVDGQQPADVYAFVPPAGSREVTLEELARANTFVAPPIFTAKAQATWHMYQCDERGNFPNGGKDFCAPTASANGLTFLGLNGYPNLFQGDDMAALKLISLLGSPDYFGTDPMEGTGDSQVIRGLLKLIGHKGYAVQSAQYRGWRPLDRAARKYQISSTMDLDWVKRGIATPNSLVLLHLGWFEPDGAGNWTRVQGHWVTGTGYGSNGGEEDPDLFLVANPGTRPSDPPADPKARLQLDTVRITPMGSGTLGTLKGDYRGLPIPARGQYQVSGRGVPISKPGRIGVLDGVVVIVLRPVK